MPRDSGLGPVQAAQHQKTSDGLEEEEGGRLRIRLMVVTLRRVEASDRSVRGMPGPEARSQMNCLGPGCIRAHRMASAVCCKALSDGTTVEELQRAAVEALVADHALTGNTDHEGVERPKVVSDIRRSAKENCLVRSLNATRV